MKCLNCENLMENEGYIADSIQLCHACYDNDTLAKHYPGKGLTIEDVSPKAVRAAQLWLWGYLATAKDDLYNHDEWQHSDGWELNLFQYGSIVCVHAYPVINGVMTTERYVLVAEGTIKPQDDSLITAYQELAAQILSGK